MDEYSTTEHMSYNGHQYAKVGFYNLKVDYGLDDGINTWPQHGQGNILGNVLWYENDEQLVFVRKEFDMYNLTEKIEDYLYASHELKEYRTDSKRTPGIVNIVIKSFSRIN